MLLKPLTARQAARCENAAHSRCRCRCGGRLHGAQRRFDFLTSDDPHYFVGREPVRDRCAERSVFAGARFRLGQRVSDLLQSGKVVVVGEIYCSDDLEHDYRYRLGFSSVVRHERDLEPLHESAEPVFAREVRS